MKNIFLITLFLFSHPVFALDRCAPFYASAPAHRGATLEKIIKKAIGPFVKTTHRRVYFYHYGYRTPHYASGAPVNTWDDSTFMPADGTKNDFNGPMDPDAMGVDEQGKPRRLAEIYFMKKASGHFGTIFQSGEFGYGLYTASEPFASISYNGGSGLMIRVGVPEGIRYLDLRKVHKSIPVEESEALWVSCFLKSISEDERIKSDIDLTWFNDRANGHFQIDPRDLLRRMETLRALEKIYLHFKVTFILGGYGHYHFEECRQNPASQFMADAVFIDPNAVSQLQVDALVPALEARLSDRKRDLYFDVLRIFDSVSSELEVKGQGPDPLDKAWFNAYYTSWAPAIEQAPVSPLDSTLAFHRSRLLINISLGVRSQITSQIFGCSKDPAFADEINP